MRVLHLTSSLGPSAVGKHLSLIAPELVPEFPMSILNLGSESPFTAPLRAAGLSVERLPWRGVLDWSCHRELRQRAVDGRFDALHIWGDTAAVAANALFLPGLPTLDIPMIVTDSHDDSSWLGKLERRTRRRAVTVCDLPAAIDVRPITPMLRSELNVPVDAEVVVAVGQFDLLADLRTVVWAFDILQYNHPKAVLVLVGDGPHRSRLERMARSLQRQQYCTIFVDPRPDVRSLLAVADVVVVPHRVGGVNVALEAMAAGRAVVARDTPELVHALGEGGVIVPQGEPREFAKRIGQLLNNSAERTHLQQAAIAQAQTIGIGTAVEFWRRVYHQIAANSTKTRPSGR